MREHHHRRFGGGHMRAGPPGRARERGITFIEIAITVTLLAVGGLSLVASMGYSARQNAMNRETSVAILAARGMVERMKSRDFAEIFPEFNADPADDPLGTSTASGSNFVVTDLRQVTREQVAGLGEIVFPVSSTGELREDVTIPELGLPRDLNGDGEIDSLDHREDASILPVMVRVQWKGTSGDREVTLHVVLKP